RPQGFARGAAGWSAGSEPSETRLCTTYEFGAGGRATAGVTKTRATAARSRVDRLLRRTKRMFMRESPGSAGATMARPGCTRVNRRPADGRWRPAQHVALKNETR